MASTALAPNRCEISAPAADRRLHRRLRLFRASACHRARWRSARGCKRIRGAANPLPGGEWVPYPAILEQRGDGEPGGCLRADYDGVAYGASPLTLPRHRRGPLPLPRGEREMSLIEGRTGKWEVVIGLEVHAQITSKAKLFSGAATAFGAEPNTQVSPIDAGFPGMLPVINRHCVEQAVKTGLGLEAEINLRSVFDRKNYFYADLPQGYQISQYLQPVVGKGPVRLDMADSSTRDIGITRLHLEQDAGKSLHDQHPALTYVDLNRSGVGLMEIVSEPDMRSAEEAGEYLRKLRSILRYLGHCG